jgi:hypothetical protein
MMNISGRKMRVPQISLLRPGKPQLLMGALRWGCFCSPLSPHPPRPTSTAPRPWSTPASLSPSARAGPPAPATSRPKPFCATSSARPARRGRLHRRHAHRPGAHAQLHRALPRQEGRRDRAGHALRDQLLAQEHQLRRRQRRRLDHRPADGHRRPVARADSPRQEARRLLGLAGLLRRRRGDSELVPTPTRPTAAATWPPNGAATEPGPRSRPSSWPT